MVRDPEAKKRANRAWDVRQREIIRAAGGEARTFFAPAGERPSDDMLAARDRRLAIPARDLTAALMGDPLPGQSALDRRRA